ncbi:RloB domain-containing protein [Aquirufa nivalisilvae]|uniref:RloB family protein n=1 Tax=Aquirufa nivalisilvae TaxID=2516557 RepID=UPI0022A9C382|nr:RloB family protein [Aquirufa nivalisilvae]MCZ2481439.1 RloB domain-containing protein [Aquirufa nivalisilvae]
MQYLNRNKNYEKVEPSKDAKKIYIFCEGSVKEVKYFNYFSKLSSNIDIIPIPSIDGKTDPIKLMERAELVFSEHGSLDGLKYILSEEYLDEVWFVIDTDNWNEGGKIQKLKDFCECKNQKYIGWFVNQSNPSFETWLYYHFQKFIPQTIEVSAFRSFKEFVNSKIPGGFNPDTMPIRLVEAIENSKANYSNDVSGQPELYSTEVFILGEIILQFVEEQLNKIKLIVSSGSIQ